MPAPLLTAEEKREKFVQMAQDIVDMIFRADPTDPAYNNVVNGLNDLLSRVQSTWSTVR
jgi:hypothetical protein